MRFLLFLLAFYPAVAHGIALQFCYDQNGQFHSAGCNMEGKCFFDGQPIPQISSVAMLKCRALRGEPERYWDGQQCSPIPIVESCKRQGGQWVEVQLRVPLTGVVQCSFVNMCACPNNLVWDARNCRSDIPVNKQVERQVNLGPKVKMTQAFFDHIGEYVHCH